MYHHCSDCFHPHLLKSGFFSNFFSKFKFENFKIKNFTNLKIHIFNWCARSIHSYHILWSDSDSKMRPNVADWSDSIDSMLQYPPLIRWSNHHCYLMTHRAPEISGHSIFQEINKWRKTVDARLLSATSSASLMRRARSFLGGDAVIEGRRSLMLTTGSSEDWKIGLLSLSVVRNADGDLMSDWSIDWLIDWMIDQSCNRLIDDWSIDWVINLVIDWLINWSYYGMINWSIDLSVDWLIDQTALTWF